MKNMIELTDADFEREVLRATGPVLVDFYAPWCGPCQMLAPVLDHLAVELGARVKFARANVDQMPELAALFDITGVPTLVLFRGGRVLGRTVGLVSPSKLKAWLDDVAGEPAPASHVSMSSR